MLKEGLLDSAGKTIARSLRSSLGFDEVKEVAIGKCIKMKVEYTNQESEADIEERIHSMCDKLLCNHIIEEYTFAINSPEE